jgi:GntR family transcriptional regulator, gluconate operon transcriptional repressor
LKPIQAARPLAEDAADRIRDETLSGRLIRGERLVEARVAGELHVSRGPVREAFKLLRAEGEARGLARRRYIDAP